MNCTHLTQAERYQIAILSKAGHDQSEIAGVMNRQLPRIFEVLRVTNRSHNRDCSNRSNAWDFRWFPTGGILPMPDSNLKFQFINLPIKLLEMQRSQSTGEKDLAGRSHHFRVSPAGAWRCG